jgi:uncharacterized membrane protein
MADQVTKSIIVKQDVHTLYKLWSDFENFPRFMENIKSVKTQGGNRSHWVMEAPLRMSMEWDAETTRRDEDRRIAWRSLDNSQMKTSGQVTFTPLPQRETQVTVTMQYVPPSGGIGEAFANLFVDAGERLEKDLRKFKAFAEN